MNIDKTGRLNITGSPHIPEETRTWICGSCGRATPITFKKGENASLVRKDWVEVHIKEYVCISPVPTIGTEGKSGVLSGDHASMVTRIAAGVMAILFV